jgi:hypothetical protein
MTPEGELKHQVKAWFEGHAYCYYFMPVQVGYGRRTLDYLICWNGMFIACEAKRKGGIARAYQQKLVAQIRACGGVAFVFDDMEDFEACMAGAEARRKALHANPVRA